MLVFVNNPILKLFVNIARSKHSRGGKFRSLRQHNVEMYRVTPSRVHNHKTLCVIMVLLLFVVFLFFNTYNRYNFDFSHVPFRIKSPAQSHNKLNYKEINKNEKYSNMKYILLWTNPKNFPFIYFGEGQHVFVKKNCRWTNCYVTGNRNFLGDYTEFHAIAFNGPQLHTMLANDDLPARRAISQKYVYANIEAATIYSICDGTWNHFFNWTWTYRLDSDSIWRYFVVRDEMNNVIGPAKNMHWLNVHSMNPIQEEFIEKLRSKKKVAAWFVSNCDTFSRREKFVAQVQMYLKRYNLQVDIYGECGKLQCPKQIMSRCMKMLEREYYFYFAFENAFSEDYVTEKVLYPLNHNTVPVVYGGANYSRFLPPGCYLDATLLGAAGLAERMFELMHSPAQYHQMFRWRYHYSFQYTHENPDSDVYCDFCKALNSPAIGSITVYKHFDAWWTPKSVCRVKRPEYM